MKKNSDDDDPVGRGLMRLNLDLDDRLRYVCAMVCAGQTDEMIGLRLGKSLRTVKNLIRVLFDATGATNRTALVAFVLAGDKSVARSEKLAGKAWKAAERATKRALT